MARKRISPKTLWNKLFHKNNSYGTSAYILGVSIAILISFLAYYDPSISTSHISVSMILVITGIIIGFFNISAEKAEEFLYPSMALIIVSTLSRETFISLVPMAMFINSMIFIFTPAVIIVAIYTVFVVAHK